MRWWLACAALAAVVRAGKPEVTVTRIPNLPNKLFYFDDSPVILLHDPVTLSVLRSEDEGKSWSAVEGVDAAARLVSHPQNNEMAFILGKHKTHWITYNRGASWQSFETPAEASLTGTTLSFHAEKSEWILFQGTVCEDTGGGKWGGGRSCWDETYYTEDAFRSPVTKMLEQTSSCVFARSDKAFKDAPEELVFCVAFDANTKPGGHSVQESRLYGSTDWFKTKRVVDLGIGRRAKGVVGLGVVSKFIVVALKVPEGAGTRRAASADPMALYVTTDGISWRQAQFPHSALPDLRENAYTIVESTTHSLAVDILTSPGASIGTLFLSSGEGTYFVEALADTNRNENGIVDFESLVGMEGVGIANVVSNREEVVGWSERKKLKSYMTYDDGSAWQPLRAPKHRLNGDDWTCNTGNPLECALHVHSITTPHNYGRVFSSTAPGFVMAVGSVGDHLLPYDDCDTFLSTDAGLTWNMVQEGAHTYEFGDQGSILVMADDEDVTDHVHYSYDGGATWEQLDLGVTVRALLLTTIPDSTSQKFLLIGTMSRRDAEKGRHALIFLDFAPLQTRQCVDKDFERWYARGGGEGMTCLMGHKQWYKRRKLDAQCYVGHKFEDPVGHEDPCPCERWDYECDFNFVRQGDECIPVGPEPVPPGSCLKSTDKYLGSSGYRRIPGNTCDREKGVKLDEKVEKECSKAKPADGEASHVIHEFESPISETYYFEKSQTILMHLEDGTVWQSSNEGFSWKQLLGQTFLAVVMHAYSSDRAYLVSGGRKMYYTTDTGRSWNEMTLPMAPNVLGIPMLDFHPTRADWLIFTGSIDCGSAVSANCRAVAYYSTEHGRRWKEIESYVRTCAWARDARLKIDEREIICESYRKKSGSQMSGEYDPIELVAGSNYYSRPQRLFDSVVGFASFSEYLLVAQLNEMAGTLSLQVSLDGYRFSEGQFPPTMRIENRAYTVLESSTDSVFLHVTMNAATGKEWGSIFKSNSNGTYYGLSVEHVNRNTAGYVDFEKMIGLDGIALINVVANPEEADISGRKKLQTRITHNDGGSWKPLPPPAKDSLGQAYECRSTSCALQIHGYTERRDVKATYSSPSAVGLMLAVGNVGEELAPYTESDIFLTRDGGFTWEEVHKDAHMWEFGDSGSVLVIVNDEEATDHVLFSLDEGLSWREYAFGEKLRVHSIQTVPQDTSRRFILVGQRPGARAKKVVVHLDFSAITQTRCKFDSDDPNHDDFELWSPSEGRDEMCLFGRQTLYHRRIRNRDCYIGHCLQGSLAKVVKNCTCTPADFECEFNHYRAKSGECVLVDGATALSVDTTYDQCDGTSEFWYERTAYRKIPYSSCEGGERPDRGERHACPGLIGGGGRGVMFWAMVALLPFVVAGGAGWWWVQKGGSIGAIRLDEHRAFGGGDRSDVLSTLASVPAAAVAAVQSGWAWVTRKVPFLDGLFMRSGRYSHLPLDDDAEVLGRYDDD